MISSMFYPSADARAHRFEDFFPVASVMGAMGVSASGQTVTPQTALTLSAYYACGRNASEDLGKLPFIPYEKLARGRRRAIDHHVYDLLTIEPNEEMGPMNFVSAVNGHAMFQGGGFATIERWNGYPEQLWPVVNGRVRVIRDKRKRLAYDVHDPFNPSKPPVRVRSEDMIHIHGFGATGTDGYPMSALARDSIGLGLSSRDYAGRFFKNDATPRSLIEVPVDTSKEAIENFKQQWKKDNGGKNSGGVGMLESGFKLSQLSVPPGDAQLIETGHFTIEDMARWFRMPPHKIQHLLRSTFSNITEQNLEYVIDCLDSWATLWQQEIRRKLFTRTERNRFYVEFLFDKMLRGDPVKRAQVNRINFAMGKNTINEMRERENENPVNGPGGDDHFIPMNLQKLSLKAAEEIAPAPVKPKEFEGGDTGEEKKEEVTEAHRGLIIDAVDAVMVKASLATERKAGKIGGADLDKWTAEFYMKQESYFAKKVGPVVSALVAILGGDEMDAELITDNHAEDYRKSMRQDADAVADEIISEILEGLS